MTDDNKNPEVDAYLGRQEAWRQEFEILRTILLGSDLTEDVKWGQPCYRLGTSNVVLMHGFKDYCALLFFKGALMDDPAGILVRQTENVQAARQIRFTAAQDIEAMRSTLSDYVKRAVEVERAGLKVAFKKTAEFPMPEEFRVRLNEAPDLKAAFEALTPGRQRAYLLHFASPKQYQTRLSRIDKCVPKILGGKGLTN
ncbi:hypothetical protein HDIA_2993 [Hartmannibacter diazotrophicus]|uniref:YdhG-like domain-containing protein n=1 Tax=Hartmannibacter diazotrophicus TaxID=1482074 RepID=A0A2C9D875_9HYPH|nr:DUF1801 domain-containing protein [Hartmannibacter diazotrophicus]SON56534.1 hypothetical protein HDIA_2993 [Hartmannibacter diazotrophicus]